MKKVGETYEIKKSTLKRKVLELINSPKPIELTSTDFNINSIVSAKSISIVEDYDHDFDASLGYSVVAHGVVTQNNEELKSVQLARNLDLLNFLGQVLNLRIINITYYEKYIRIYTSL